MNGTNGVYCIHGDKKGLFGKKMSCICKQEAFSECGDEMEIDDSICDVLILAGGKNSRMNGRFKGSLQFHDMKFIEKIRESLLDETGTLIISYSSPEKVPVIMPECKIVYDEIHNVGPIAGLISGLKSCCQAAQKRNRQHRKGYYSLFC